MRAAHAPDGDLKFHAPAAIKQLRVCNTGIVSFTEFEDGVADGVASVYRPNPQTEPERMQRRAIAAARGVP